MRVRPLASGSAVLALLLAADGPAWGHYNSPHIYVREKAGPYPVIVAITMPSAVPGEALVQVMLEGADPGESLRVEVREIPPGGEALAPDWVEATPSQSDPNFLAAPLSLMLYGLYHADVKVSGARGEGKVRIPIPARIPRPQEMGPLLKGFLLALGVVLLLSLAQILYGLGRDAHRPASAGTESGGARRGALWVGGGFALVGLHVGLLVFYPWYVFHRSRQVRGAPRVFGELRLQNPPAVAGKRLELQLSVSVRERGRAVPLLDAIPDHGKIMHLAAIKLPDATAFLHVHPRMPERGLFTFSLVPPEPGTYRLYGDILRASGEGDTVTADLEIGAGPVPSVIPFDDPDDSASVQGALDRAAPLRASRDVGDGLTLRWVEPPGQPLPALEFRVLEFELVETASGRPVEGLEPYMGMAGHLMVMGNAGDVFAHLHPMGTVSMAALAVAAAGTPHSMMSHAGMASDPAGSRGPSVVSFPYAFPSKGLYRLFVQVKHGGKVRTGAFDARVE